jgi:hypothetical protein
MIFCCEQTDARLCNTFLALYYKKAIHMQIKTVENSGVYSNPQNVITLICNINTGIVCQGLKL